jgi:hypothetical protein
MNHQKHVSTVLFRHLFSCERGGARDSVQSQNPCYWIPPHTTMESDPAVPKAVPSWPARIYRGIIHSFTFYVPPVSEPDRPIRTFGVIVAVSAVVNGAIILGFYQADKHGLLDR